MYDKFFLCAAFIAVFLCLSDRFIYSLCWFLDWFTHGKGPNPDIASLDRDMDDYFKNKKSTDQEDSNQAESVK
jgi:hypothetical protein